MDEYLTASNKAYEANRFIRRLLHNANSQYGLGSMTVSIYDTAWIACVSKEVAGRHQWLFPSSYETLLRTQTHEGGWVSKDVGGERADILSTLAALYSLMQHAQYPMQLEDAYLSRVQLDQRIQNANTCVLQWLQSWTAIGLTPVGFEILMPALLEMLERKGLSFEFPQRETLYALRDQKLTKINFHHIYTGSFSTLLHSLEAFYEDMDFNFNLVSDQLSNGSLMSSPSSTAAYLMRKSSWDEEAEAYLRLVISNGAGRGCGAAPSAYPSANFEVIWCVSAILDSISSLQVLEVDTCTELSNYIDDLLRSGGGLVGFDRGLQPDLDDSSKAIVMAAKLNLSPSTEPMVKAFGQQTHFQTYSQERHSSFTANANALQALVLTRTSLSEKSVATVIHYLLEEWLRFGGPPQDKWNVSLYYSTMAMANALHALLDYIASDDRQGISQELMQKVILVTIQSFVWTIRGQNTNGSWGHQGPNEETSYAIITLARLSELTFINQFFEDDVRLAMNLGKEYLSNQKDHAPEHLWIEKVCFGSEHLSTAYRIAAMISLPSQRVIRGQSFDIFGRRNNKRKHWLDLVENLPLLSDQPRWLTLASSIEAEVILPLLRSQRNSVFSRHGFTKDEYFDWIGRIWVLSKNVEGKMAGIPFDFLLAMMTISFLNFQVDEFMEVSTLPKNCDKKAHFDSLRDIIERAFKMQQITPTMNSRTENSDNGIKNGGRPSPIVNLATIEESTVRFLQFITEHHRMAEASANDQIQLQHELKIFLLAHVSQAEQSAICLSLEEQTHPATQNGSSIHALGFKNWVTGIAANHTSCPYSFIFAACIFPTNKHDFFNTVYQKYVADDLCRHLAIMCRMYNDLGSLARDRQEQNLNSIDFFDFPGAKKLQEVEAAKRELLALAEYERGRLDQLLSTLESREGSNGLESKSMAMIRVFVTVTDMFGQIYVRKDLASRRLDRHPNEK